MKKQLSYCIKIAIQNILFVFQLIKSPVMNTTVRSKSMLDTTKPLVGPLNTTVLDKTKNNLDTTQQPMVLRQRQVNPGIPSSPARSQSVQGMLQPTH